MTLEVLGAGFGRTGTNSLRRALEILGFGPCHHMFEISHNEELLPDWEAIARGETPDWKKIFKGYRSQVDWPGARYWKELAEYYPNAKVILSVREPEDWYTSVENTILNFMSARGMLETEYGNRQAHMAYELIGHQTFDDRFKDRAHCVQVFKDHIAEVQANIAPERLLTYTVGSGWKPLCEFLNVDVPDVDYPNTNSTKHFNEGNPDAK